MYSPFINFSILGLFKEGMALKSKFSRVLITGTQIVAFFIGDRDKKAVRSLRIISPMITKIVKALVIYGKAMSKFLIKKNINLWIKRLVRQLI
jgi:hypothetical protein